VEAVVLVRHAQPLADRGTPAAEWPLREKGRNDASLLGTKLVGRSTETLFLVTHGLFLTTWIDHELGLRDAPYDAMVGGPSTTLSKCLQTGKEQSVLRVMLRALNCTGIAGSSSYRLLCSSF
jgi:broad specificity phosphatase PhoE